MLTYPTLDVIVDAAETAMEGVKRETCRCLLVAKNECPLDAKGYCDLWKTT
jgi:hypothetical protein